MLSQEKVRESIYRVAGPLGVGSPWSAFVGSGGSAGLQRSISSGFRCRCSSGARRVVLLSGVRLSRGGSRWCGGGCVSLVGCGRRSFRAPAPPRPTPPDNDAAEQETNPAGQASRVPALLSLQTPSAKSWQATAELATLGRPPGTQRLTRRLFTTLHSAPLTVGPAPVRNPHRAAERNESGGTVPARGAKPP